MRYKRSVGDYVFDSINYILIFLLCASILMPVMYVISLSLSSSNAASLGFILFPRELSVAAYRRILTSPPVIYGYLNTIFRTVVGTALSLIFIPAASYSLSKKSLPYRTPITLFFVFTMFFGGGLIANYLLISKLHLIDNRWVFVLPGIYSTWYMLIMRNFFMSIPDGLEDAAKIDGASDLKVLYIIVYPISLPVLCTVGLWLAVGHWNSYFDSLIFIRTLSKHVLQVQLRQIVLETSNVTLQKLLRDTSVGASAFNTETVKAAMTVVTMLPIIMVYPFVQKYFVKGIMIGSLKG